MDRAMLPFDFTTAGKAFQDLRSAAAPHGESGRQVLWFVLPMALGMLLGYSLLPAAFANGGNAPVLSAVAGGMLAYSAILVGFVVTLMLFTGRIERPQSLAIEHVKALVARLNYLLYSQIVTLLASVLLASSLVLWSLLLAAGASTWALLVTGCFCVGIMMVCFVRTVLLPFQIYEIHRAGFNAALDASRAAAATRRSRYSHEDK